MHPSWTRCNPTCEPHVCCCVQPPVPRCTPTYICMPSYQCHNIVWALQIDHFDCNKLYFSRGEYAPREVSPELVQRCSPIHQGDYFVIYNDGHETIVPKKDFEQSYTPLSR